MKTKQPLTPRQLCDASALFHLQATQPMTMTDVTVDGPTLRAGFSERVECPKQKRRGVHFTTTEIQFDCPDETIANQWHQALSGGQKLSPENFATSELKIEDVAKPEPLPLGAKIVSNPETGLKDSVKIRFAAQADGTIPYEVIPCASPKAAREIWQKYTQIARENMTLRATL